MDSIRAFGGFASAVFGQWTKLLTGGVMIAGLSIFEHEKGNSISWPLYVAMIAGLFILACFFAYKEQFIRNLALTADLARAQRLAETARHDSRELHEMRQAYEATRAELDDLRATVGSPFPFSPAQRRVFVRSLAKVPPHQRFKVEIIYPGLGGSAGPARSFAEAVQQAGWEAVAYSNPLTNPGLRGVVLATSQAAAEGRAQLPPQGLPFVNALNEAGVAFAIAHPGQDSEPNHFELIVAEP